MNDGGVSASSSLVGLADRTPAPSTAERVIGVQEPGMVDYCGNRPHRQRKPTARAAGAWEYLLPTKKRGNTKSAKQTSHEPVENSCSLTAKSGAPGSTPCFQTCFFTSTNASKDQAIPLPKKPANRKLRRNPTSSIRVNAQVTSGREPQRTPTSQERVPIHVAITESEQAVRWPPMPPKSKIQSPPKRLRGRAYTCLGIPESVNGGSTNENNGASSEVTMNVHYPAGDFWQWTNTTWRVTGTCTSGVQHKLVAGCQKTSFWSLVKSFLPPQHARGAREP